MKEGVYMLVAEGVTSITGLMPVINDFISTAPTLINFCLTTFPLNVGVALGLAGMVVGFVRKMKPAGRA